MKLLILSSLLLSGGGAVAMQNDTINETVNEHARPVIERIQQRLKGRLVDRVKEEGFPYPSEEYLATLPEEDAVIITTTIDQINATYDWNTMTDEEIIDALSLVKEELHALFEERDISLPYVFRQDRRREQIRDRIFIRLQEEGIPYPSDTYLATLSEDQLTQLIEKIDELNATYDFESMSEDELLIASQEIKEEMQTLFEELDIEPPLKQAREEFRHRRNQRRRDHHKNRYDNESPTDEDSLDIV